MPVPTEGTLPPLSGTPAPAYFRHSEPGFFLKRRRRLSQSLPPRPPAKGCIPVSRIFPWRTPGWHQPRTVSFRAEAPELLQSTQYDPGRPESFFQQCFQQLGHLGHGSYGEVFKVRSKENGHLYAVKRSLLPFRGPKDRVRKLAEVRGHEKVGQHPRCVRLERAWEERGLLYLQMELCGLSLQQHCEAHGTSLPEGQVWSYLRDTLLALAHLHGQGLVHLDIKPANIFLGPRGRCKLGDFGLLVELGSAGASEAQEGDPRYMAPELLQDSYGTAADIFSLGLTILEVACNMELPCGGEGWQQLRQGYLPPEFTSGLSSELCAILAMMLEPDPTLRATARVLLSLPMLKEPRPWSVLWSTAADALSRGWALWQALVSLLYWLYHSLARPANWLQPPAPPATPPCSPHCTFLQDHRLSSNVEDNSFGDLLDLSNTHPAPSEGSLLSFEPRNLLSMFEDSLDPSSPTQPGNS
ncbi:PREDICTED: membrane-associated tyrosine- and threonine-specific cdc2-inhibitory kinase [Elephantulus edwardii]|uniref:membrane-associated tyrosine- and threonine-specific cdc2-inhibitory kinase n=1 Tax=Elephantulus edwardii TaxID=28737 RepID=UPI0003F0A53E|nr:PREDICTED: membrane-associated tyrosine- and threonine-specific cdc2-inhibitory kinase [Elephantulus edwardii]